MQSGDQLLPANEGPSKQGADGIRPRVLAKTAQWLVLDKPAGWLTIPGRQTDCPVVSTWVEREFGKAWVVHRLDRETSGVLLMALSAEAHREAGIWFQKHEVRKAYDLLARGTLRAPVVRVKKPIEGAPSATQVEAKEKFPHAHGGAFLGRALPLSGRRHQIRIHLAQEGCPILGDPTYGGPREIQLGAHAASLGLMPVRLLIPRVALHAARLELPTREVFEAPWPADFAGWVAVLRERRGDGGNQ